MKKELFIILLFLSSALGFTQTITPTKTVTVRPGVCGIIDVELKIQGTNPVSRPIEVVLVIDVSGSMGDGNNPKPIAHAKTAAKDFIDKVFLPANNPTGNNRVSIVKYSSTASIVEPLTPVAGKQDLIDAVNALVANGSTNIQDGIKKADDELTAHGTFDCVTSRSIVLLTDGVANRTGNDQSCTSGQGGSCIQSAITAATNAKTTTVSSVVYNNQIFSVGLFGAISGAAQTDAEYTLNQIQSGGSYFTEIAADLTSIYTQIFTQLSWVAQQINGTPFDKETVSSEFTIGTVTASKGTAPVSGQIISWNIDFLNVETITLKYELTPKANVCGTKTVSTSRLDYKNSACATSFLDINTPTTNIPCPTVTLASQTNINCYGGSTGAIDITAAGGIGPYTYAWTGTGVNATVEDQTGLVAGIYKVIIKDANGCASSELSVTITQPASAVAVVKTSKTDVLCYGASTGAINITASGGTGAYTYDWADLAGTNDVEDRTGLAAGTYTVTVKDANDCSTAALSVTIEQPASAVAVVKTSQTDVLCYGASTGAINITASGGTGAYTYDWDDLAGTNNIEDRTGLAAGTYTVTVKDANDCSTAALSVTIEQTASAVAVVKTSQTDVLCYGASTGAINITASGGTGAYTYDWDDLAGTNNIEDRTGLAAGTYTVTVKDANDCSTAALSVTIEQPASAVVLVKTSKTDVLCYGASTGAINITASGGTGAYTYDWADLAGTNDVEDRTGLAAGTYTVTVKDAYDCSTAALSVTIEQPASAATVVKTSQTDVLCYGASTGAINITASGGTGAYTYDWDDLAGTNNIEDRTGLAAGTYTVTVKDANDCSTAALSVTIEQPASAATVVKTSKTDVLCYGASTGAINITASGGTGAYTYDWADLAGTNDVEDRTGLAAGTYTVTVKDANDCSTAALSVTIEQPASAVAVVKTSQTDVLCYGASTGAINITASGGTGAYTYDWDDLAGTNNIEDRTGLAAGTYTVTVKDANDCSTAALSVTIEQPASAATVVKTSKTDVLCYGASTGAINITASGGTGAYTYDWADLAGTNDVEDRTGLAAGTYTVTVKDANDCSTAALSVTIEQPQSALTCSVTQNKAVSSNGLSDGEATVTPLGGNGGYSYLWDNGETTAHAIGLNAGLHSVTVTDSNGCKTTCEITISEPNVLSCSVTQNAPAKCYGDSNGKATVTAIGGNGDYTYLWDNGETTAQAVGLNAGSHTVTVTDKLGYKTTCNVTIGQPQAALTCSIVQNKAVSSNGLSDGEATVTPVGGNGGYSYLWDNGETTAHAIGLNAGLHSVTVTDSKGCQTTCEITISEPNVLSCSITQDAPAKCYGDSNGKATVTAIGGNGDYTYLWDNGETTAQAVGLSADSHTVTVTDKLGYKTTCNVTIGQPQAALSATAVITNNNNCDGCSNGSINLTVSGGTAPYTFEWSNGATTEDISNLPNGTYNVVITDNKGCKANYTYIISESSINITKDGTYVDSNQDGITNVGDVISYNFVITNTGSVTLTNVMVTDNNAVITGGPIPTLAPGATDSTTFSGSHVITQADINTGYVYNLATATAKDPENETVTDTSSDPTPCTTCPIDPECPDCTITPLTQTPGLVITKTSTTASYSVVGDVINYTIIVKNTGNATLHQIVVKDPLTGLDTIIDVLAPGASSEYTQSYTVTQEDLNNGSVTNIATADGFTPKDVPISDSDDEIVNEKVNVIDAVDDAAGPIDGINGATNVLNVFNNDTLNTIAVNPADVTLTLVTPDATGYMTMNPDGSIDIKDGTPAGTYTLVYQICENANSTNCDSATVTLTVICNDTTKIAGTVFNAGTNTPLANVPVTLIPQGTTTGPILIRITNAQGYYNFTGMVPGDYLVQVQDANLNSAYQLYPVDSSLFFTTLINCVYQFHDFGYDKSDLPVLGDYVWYDVNNNGLQDEWFDANNDGLVTKNIVDANGSFDYSKWEWIDLNGDDSYKGSLNLGELNAAGFGNAKSPNIFVTGPNDYAASAIIGIQGFWRNRPPVGAFGDYKVELKMDANLEAQSSAMGATGLVKVLPGTGKNINSPKTGKPASFEVCGPTNENPQTAAVTADNQVHLDIDFGISCKMYANITATNDTFSVTQCSIIEQIRNALSNDLLDGVPASNSAFRFKLLTALGQYIKIDDAGNISFVSGVAAGQYTFDYQVCEAANPTNCATATITINVGAIDPVTITSQPFCNADTTPIDLSILLPEGVSTDGTWIDTDNTGGLNGNTFNAFGIPINTYHFEYKIAGDCPRSILLVMDINDDCKVLPCKAIIVHNAFSATEDGRNDYFQIENLEENDCYKNIRVEVFNRWGVLVFEKDNYNNGNNAFRGRSEGRTTIKKSEGLPTGTYFYILSYDTTDDLGKTQSVKKDGYLYLIK